MQQFECIFFKFAKANQLAGKFLGQKVAEFNVTPVQALILAILTKEDRITSVELGKRAELDSATLTGILDRLESGQYLSRQSNTEDRRSIRIHLTDSGKATGKQISKTIVAANREFLARLSAEEKSALHSIINKLRDTV